MGRNGIAAGRGADLFGLLVGPAFLGAGTGALVALLSSGVEERALVWLAQEPAWLCVLASLVALPLATSVALYVTRARRPSTSELYIETYHSDDGHIPVHQAPGRVLAAIATVGFGGSQGFESPSALLGASGGELLGRVRSLVPSEEARRTLVTAGASAGIAAVFSSPGVGALYGMEIPFRRDLDAPRFIPAAVAASAAYAVRVWLVGARPLIPAVGGVELSPPLILAALLLAVLCGFGARLFAAACAGIRHLSGQRGPWGRAMGAGLVFAGIAFAGHALSDRWISFGPGYVAVEWLFSATHPLWLLGVVLLLRTAGTLLCVLGGGGGGVFTSLACTGAFVGQLVASATEYAPERVLPLLGAACFLGAGYRIPIAAILLVAEQSRNAHLVLVAIVAVALSQLCMGNASVSDAQRDRRGV